MERLRILSFGILLMLLIAMSVSCSTANSTPASTTSPPIEHEQTEEFAELQPRGKGAAELVTNPVYDGIYSVKLTLPENYNMGDAARMAVPLKDCTLNDITDLSFWCYIDPNTPVNSDGYWVPYITFEIDTDGEPGCDTWVIGGGETRYQSSGVWFINSMNSDWLFHVPSAISGYTSPFPLSNMGTLEEIKLAMSPDGRTPLGDCIVSKVRLAIGNWGPGGPISPVICYIDYLTCNGELVF